MLLVIFKLFSNDGIALHAVRSEVSQRLGNCLVPLLYLLLKAFLTMSVSL